MGKCVSYMGDTKRSKIPITRWFTPNTPVSSTNKTDRYNIAEILLKVALSTTTLTPI